jgi:hypothetical protein
MYSVLGQKKKKKKSCFASYVASSSAKKSVCADSFSWWKKGKKKKKKKEHTSHKHGRPKHFTELKRESGYGALARRAGCGPKSTENVACLCLRSSIISTDYDELTSYKNQ